MMNKQILPESFDFGCPSVEIIGCGSRGLDKTAMVKRASMFDDMLGDIKQKPGKTYLHVITTGAYEHYNANRNGDAFNESRSKVTFPYPENMSKKAMMLDGGLMEYHDKSYMSKEAAVYQEHDTKQKPSGEIVAARYNPDMHRGELIIAVDNDKWAKRLHKKASGEDIYLSMGCRVEHDTCMVCGRMAKTAGEHCDHFKKMKCNIMDDGTQCCVMNDAPHFYDISGVNVPADKIAFVLRKVASGEMAKTAMLDAMTSVAVRKPIPFCKAAAVMHKLSKMEKRVLGVVEDAKKSKDSKDDGAEYADDPEAQRKLVIMVRSYPADEVISSTMRKGILLSPSSLFSIMGGECEDPFSRSMLMGCDDDCCGNCGGIISDLEDDEDCSDVLLDGSFDSRPPIDLGLDRILEQFIPALGMSGPAVGSRSIHIVISGGPRTIVKMRKRANFNSNAEAALRKTYARYLLAFAERNDDVTCMNALRKVAGFGN